MNSLFGISFESPWWFLLGLTIPLGIWWYIAKNKKSQVTLVYVAPPVGRIKKSFRQKTVHFPFILRMFALSCFIVAMARPQGTMGDEDRNVEGIDIVIALDVSWSMIATDLQPSRLDVAKKLSI